MRGTPKDLIRPLDAAWMVDAACAGIPGLPWIENPRRVPGFVVGQMSEVCSRCPVLDECAGFADKAHVTAGFWAGHSRNHLTVDDFHVRDGGEAA